MKNKFFAYYRNHPSLCLIFLFSAIASLLFMSLSLHQNIWYDEAYQLILNENNLFDIISYVANDFHGPFYAVGLKLFTFVFGGSIVTGRIFSLLSILCCFILVFTKIKSLFSFKTAFLFSLFLLSFSCIYFCAIEIRPYSWPMFFTLASTTYMIAIIKEPDRKNWLLYILFSVLAMYSHHFALFYVFISHIILGCFLLIKNRKQIKYYLLSSVIRIICYLPWLFILVNQYRHLKNHFWIEAPVFSTFLRETSKLFSQNMLIAYGLILLVLISILYVIVKHLSKVSNYIILITFLSTVAFCYLISKYLAPILTVKYLVTFIGPLLLIMADFIGTIKNKIWLTIVLGIIFINAYYNYQYEKKLTDETNLFALKQYIEQNREEPLVFLHYSEFSLGVFRYYFPNATHLFTSEISSNLTDYRLFGKQVISLETIKDLPEIESLWVINIKENSESEQYFQNWKKRKKYLFINTYSHQQYRLENLKK